MDVAELQARLVADIGSLMRGLSQADAAMENTRRLAGGAEHAVKQIKMDSKQAFETAAVATAINREVERVGRTAERTADYLQDVKMHGIQAAQTRLVADSQVDSLQKIERQAIRTRVAMAGAGGKDNVLGINSIGTGRSLVLAGVAAALPVLPQLAAGTLGLGAAGAGGIGALLGGAAVLKLAFADITKQAFTTQKAFDKLNESQKALVQQLRSLDAGLKVHLEHIAQASIIPAVSQGINAAMSPGTVNAITDTVKKFSAAVATAAQEWGKFIGGSFGQQLGQLLQNDAKYFVALNREFMVGADILVRFLNVAAPLTDWLSNLASGAMKSADAWAQSAHGVHQMNQVITVAKQGITDVGHVLGGLFNALQALTAATGSFNTLNLLAQVLNEIARIVNDNKDSLRNFFAGAQTSVNDILTAIDKLRRPIKDVLFLLESVAKTIGGWRVMIDGVVVFFLAKMLLAKLGASSLAKALLSIGPAAAEGAAAADIAIASTGATAAAATGEMGALKLGLLALASPEVLFGLAAVAAALLLIDDYRTHHTAGHKKAGGGNTEIFEQGGKWYERTTIGRNVVTKEVSAAKAKADLGGAGGGGSGSGGNHGPGQGAGDKGSSRYSQADIYNLLLSQGVPPNVAANLSTISAHGEDPSGNPRALNDNPRTGDYSVGLFQENFLGKMGKGRVAQFAPQFGMSGNMGVKQFVSWLGNHPAAQAQIAYQIYQSQGYGAWTTAKGLGITDAGSPYAPPPPLDQTGMKKPPGPPTGLNLLPAALANQLAKASTGTPNAAGTTWKLDTQALADLNAKLKDHNLSAKEKLAIDKEIGVITRQQETAYKVLAAASKSSMRDQVNAEKQKAAEMAAALKAAMKLALEDAKEQLALAQTAFRSAFTMIANAADAAFQAGTQKTLDVMQVLVDSPLGKFMFGGEITQTPAGQALSAMQEQHTVEGLQAQLKAAQDAVKNATGSGTVFDAATGIYSSLPGDTGTMAAAQQQLADAQYAIKEHQLQKEDAIESAAAQKQLADAKAAYQDQRNLIQQAMDQQVQAIEQGMESGKIAADSGFAQLKAIWSSNGIDLQTLSFALGGDIYTGLAAGLEPVFKMLDNLIAQLNRVASLGGDNPNVPATGQAVATTYGVAAGSYYGTLDPANPTAGGGNVTVNINGTVYGTDSAHLAGLIRDQLLLTARRNGNSAFGGLA